MTVSRAIAAMILTTGLTAACTSSGHGGNGSTSPTPSGSTGSTGAAASCNKASAKAATTVVISGQRISPACVKLARGKSFSIVNGSAAAVHGTLSAPSKKRTTVDLPHKNSVYPFTGKKKGTYKFRCKGCSNRLQIFVT